jgi:hypothetical protein
MFLEFGGVLTICLVLFVAAILARKMFHKHKKHSPKYSYIAPISHKHKSGWTKVKHASKWVRVRTLHAPDYSPQQGIHYFPYCKGRHFEYVFDVYDSKIYKRKLHRH